MAVSLVLDTPFSPMYVHIFVFLVAFFALEGTNIRSGTGTVVRVYTNQRLGSFGSSDCNSVCARKRVLSFFVVFNVHCVIWGEEAFQLFNLFPNLPFALSLPSPVLDSTESVRYVFLCFPSFFPIQARLTEWGQKCN